MSLLSLHSFLEKEYRRVFLVGKGGAYVRAPPWLKTLGSEGQQSRNLDLCKWSNSGYGCFGGPRCLGLDLIICSAQIDSGLGHWDGDVKEREPVKFLLETPARN